METEYLYGMMGEDMKANLRTIRLKVLENIFGLIKENIMALELII